MTIVVVTFVGIIGVVLGAYWFFVVRVTSQTRSRCANGFGPIP